MKEWEIGSLPQGWKRGEALKVLNCNYRQGPRAALARVDHRALGGAADEASDEYEIYACLFSRADLYRVEPWLLWYFDGGPEAYRIIAQIQ